MGMGRPTKNAGLKSESAAPNPVAADRTVLNVIRSKEGNAIWLQDLNRETKLAENVVKKSVKSLLDKSLIKEVVNVKYNRKKHYMAIEFEPSEEISGGVWYDESGHIDDELIDGFKKLFLKTIPLQKVVTVDKLCDMLNNMNLLTFNCSSEQAEAVLKSMVLDDQINEVMINGEKGYALSKDECVKIGAMASIPCGMCSVSNYCTVDGIISPSNCVYFQSWLDF